MGGPASLLLAGKKKDRPSALEGAYVSSERHHTCRDSDEGLKYVVLSHLSLSPVPPPGLRRARPCSAEWCLPHVQKGQRATDSQDQEL